MRDSFPSSRSRLAAYAGTGALLVLIVIVLTGGFLVEIGGVRVSARRWPTPLLVAAFGWLYAARHGWRSLRDSAAAVTTAVDRHARLLAVVCAVGTAAVGVGLGTYAAAGADAAGYLNQAQLFAGGRVVRLEPLADEVGWPRAGQTLSPLGYRPGLGAAEIVPTYPPGLPLAMAAARELLGDTGPFLIVPALAALAVLCTYALGAARGSPVAGLTAAVLMASSPIALFQAVQPMSDVPAAAWWALAVVCAMRGTAGSSAAAGAATALAVLTRPNLLPLVLVVFATRPRVWPFCAAALPGAAALAWLNARWYGGVAANGYGRLAELYDVANVIPNLRDYVWRLAAGEMPAIVLAAAASLYLIARQARRGPSGGQRVDDAERGPAEPSRLRSPQPWPRLVPGLACALVVAAYLPYAQFAEWSYLRFLLPALPFAFALVGACVSVALREMPAPARGVVLLVALVATASVNVRVAAAEQAFNLHRYDARYRDVGRYLAASLPPEAVVIAVQESASVSHYTNLPVVRWDLLTVDLDTALTRLRALGRRPVLLVEAWERADLAARFPRSAAARLDWPPRMEAGAETRVRLYDPADRDAPPRTIPPDRLP